MSKYLSYCLYSIKNLNKFTRKKGNKLSYKIPSTRIYVNKKGTNYHLKSHQLGFMLIKNGQIVPFYSS